MLIMYIYAENRLVLSCSSVFKQSTKNSITCSSAFMQSTKNSYTALFLRRFISSIAFTHVLLQSLSSDISDCNGNTW